MVLVCKNINERFNINTYHNNLIKNRTINIYNVVKNNTPEINDINEINNENKRYFDEIKNDNIGINIDIKLDKSIQKDVIFIKNFVKIKN